MDKVEYGEMLLKILLSQYDNSVKFSGLHQQFGDKVFDDMEDNIFNIYNMCDLDNATGNNLDAAASLIGLNRMLIRIPTTVWTLDETPFTGYVFGDKDYLIFEICPDDIFRDAIKAYAYTQTCYGSMDDVLNTLALILGVDISDLSLVRNAQQDYTINAPASVDVGRKYLTGLTDGNYRTPNDGFLWALPAGVSFEITYS